MAAAMKKVIRHVCVFFLLGYFQIITLVKCTGNLIVLNEDNWSDILEGEWMVEFFAPWCPACKSMESVWGEFAGWSDDLGIKVGHVDVTTNPGLSGRFMVTALPTIYHVKDGVFRQYRGTRDKDSFMSFVEEKKWSDIESVSSWKSPQSLQMSVVAYFFKLSMALRAVHNKMVEEFGIPHWGSYIIFALGTILVGALLGLIIVCMIDLIFPTKPPMAPVPDSTKKDSSPEKESEESEEEDDIDDDIKDDTDSLENQELRQRKTEAVSED